MSVGWYTKAPAPVQAMQLTKPSDIEEAAEWINSNGGSCSWISTSSPSEFVHSQDWLTVHTVEGAMSAFLGDWIVLGETGGFWTVRWNVFESIYRPTKDEHVNH